MSDEEIIELWKKGWSIEKIAYNFPSIRFREGKELGWKIINRVETVMLNYQKNGGVKCQVKKKLKKQKIIY